MKNVMYFAAIIGLFILTSCSNFKTNDALSGHLLMVPYSCTTLTTARVIQEFDAMEDATDEEKLETYKEVFAHPYSHDMHQVAQQILEGDYQINDASTTASGIEKLISDAKDGEHKAFEYAKAVNVANFAYAAGYINLSKVKEYVQIVLTRASRAYSNWDDFLENFLDGRAMETVDQNLEYQQLFEDIVLEVLLEYDESPYHHYAL